MGRLDIRSSGVGVTGPRSNKEITHWWWERVSAVALVPLSLWFVASIVGHTGSDYATFIAWLRNPLASVPMMLLLVALFHHVALGLEVVIGDYIHSRTRLVVLAAMRLSCAALAIGGVVATLRIASGG